MIVTIDYHSAESDFIILYEYINHKINGDLAAWSVVKYIFIVF